MFCDLFSLEKWANLNVEISKFNEYQFISSPTTLNVCVFTCFFNY